MANVGSYGGTLTTKPDGPRLKALRGGKTQASVEAGADISRGQLTRYERGLPASIFDMLKLGAYYNVDPVELLSAEGKASVEGLLDALARLANKRIAKNGEEVTAATPVAELQGANA